MLHEESRGLILKSENYVFISYLDSDYSRTSVYLTSFTKKNYLFWKVQGSKISKIRSLLILSMKYSRARTTYIVMSPCHSLVIPLRFLTLRPIILDAGWSLTEALLARNLGPKFSSQRLFTYITDLLSFHLANASIFESQQQCIWVQKKFALNNSKVRSLFTGFNESIYRDLNPVMPVELDERIEYQTGYILFRGSFTNEAGLDLLYGVTQADENLGKKFIIATNRKLEYFEKCSNVLFLQRRLSESEIKYLYQNCSIAIGQLRKTLRSINTVPHKAFEAAYFAKPYLTADSLGIREFLTNADQAIYTDSESVEVLADLLHRTVTDKALLTKTGALAKTRYDEVASQEKLQNQFSTILTTFNRA